MRVQEALGKTGMIEYGLEVELHDLILYPLLFLRVASNLLMTGPKVKLKRTAWPRQESFIRLETNKQTLRFTPQAYLRYARSVQMGVQSGIVECKHQFAWDRWNCPDSATLPKGLRRGKLRKTRFFFFTHEYKM